VGLTYWEMARATGRLVWAFAFLVIVVAAPAVPLAQSSGRRRPNLGQYELRCGDSRIPLVDLWKSCRYLPGANPADPDMPLTDAELRQIRRGTAGAWPTSCEVVPVASTNPPRELAIGDSTPKDPLSEFSQLLRASIFVSTLVESQQGCLSPEQMAFKKLVARRRSDLLNVLARDATPAGRLYGLCALRLARDGHYRALLRDAARSPRTMVLMDSCTPRVVSLRTALAAPRDRSRFEAECDALQSAVADTSADCGV